MGKTCVSLRAVSHADSTERTCKYHLVTQSPRYLPSSRYQLQSDKSVFVCFSVGVCVCVCVCVCVYAYNREGQYFIYVYIYICICIGIYMFVSMCLLSTHPARHPSKMTTIWSPCHCAVMHLPGHGRTYCDSTPPMRRCPGAHKTCREGPQCLQMWPETHWAICHPLTDSCGSCHFLWVISAFLVRLLYIFVFICVFIISNNG